MNAARRVTKENDMITNDTTNDKFILLNPGQFQLEDDFKGDVIVLNPETQSTALVTISNSLTNEIFDNRRVVNPSQHFRRKIELEAKQIKVQNDSQVARIHVLFLP